LELDVPIYNNTVPSYHLLPPFIILKTLLTLKTSKVYTWCHGRLQGAK